MSQTEQFIGLELVIEEGKKSITIKEALLCTGIYFRLFLKQIA